MSISLGPRPFLLSIEAYLISLDEYISMIQSSDIKSATSKILQRKIGEIINDFIEQKKTIKLDDVLLLIDEYYQNKILNLCTSNNKYTLAIEDISDFLNTYLATQCIVSLKKPCVFFPTAGLYRSWITGGEKGVLNYLLTNKALSVIYRKAVETSKIEATDYIFSIKSVWEKIVIPASFPARKVLGFFYDFALLRVLITTDNFELANIATAYIPKEELLIMFKGIKENKLENLRIIDKYLPGFSETYLEITKIAPKTTSLDASLLLMLGYLTRNLFYDFNESNLRKYLLLLREAFLLRLIYIVLLSGLDKTPIINVLTRRLI